MLAGNAEGDIVAAVEAAIQSRRDPARHATLSSS